MVKNVKLEQIADKVIEITEKIGERKFMNVISEMEKGIADNDIKKFSFIVSACCQVFYVTKCKILEHKRRKSTLEVECTAAIFKLAREYTNYRVVDIAFMLKIGDVSSLYEIRMEYCDNLNPKIPRHRDLIQKHEACEKKLKELLKL